MQPLKLLKQQNTEESSEVRSGFCPFAFGSEKSQASLVHLLWTLIEATPKPHEAEKRNLRRPKTSSTGDLRHPLISPIQKRENRFWMF